LISENDGVFKHHLDRFKYTDRYPGESRDEHRDAGLRILAAGANDLSNTLGYSDRPSP
jgi:glutathione S-transferase